MELGPSEILDRLVLIISWATLRRFWIELADTDHAWTRSGYPSVLQEMARRTSGTGG